jgi:acyl-coenzyme A synthetase/AMP-(fatty) acid ligase
MTWMNLDQLLVEARPGRGVTFSPTMDHEQLREQALRLAGGLRERGVRRLAVHLEDAGDLAVALLGAWRAGVSVLLPADLQTQTRQRWAEEVDLWLTGDIDALYAEPMPAAALDLDQCQLSLCTSGSSGEPKRIDKHLRQLANEVYALEQLWSDDLGNAAHLWPAVSRAVATVRRA